MDYNEYVSVRNTTKKTVLVDQVKFAQTILEKTRGLLGSDTPEVLLIKTRFGIHTFGMKYAIDVMILDKNNRVVKLRPSLPPNSIVLWNPKYDTIIEMPEGIIEKTHTEIGDLIELT